MKVYELQNNNYPQMIGAATLKALNVVKIIWISQILNKVFCSEWEAT